MEDEDKNLLSLAPLRGYLWPAQIRHDLVVYVRQELGCIFGRFYGHAMYD